jgi:hypothetical protein
MEARGAWVNYLSSKIIFISFFVVVFKTTNEFTTLIFQWSKHEIRTSLLIFYFPISFNRTYLILLTTANVEVPVLDQPGHFRAKFYQAVLSK